MLEDVWTAMAQRQVQHIFAQNEDHRPGSGVEWLAILDAATEQLRKYPESAPLWREPYRRLVLHRHLGIFYAVLGRRLVINGIFPLSMSPRAILTRLLETDWP